MPSVCILTLLSVSRFRNLRPVSSPKYFNFLLIYISGVETQYTSQKLHQHEPHFGFNKIKMT